VLKSEDRPRPENGFMMTMCAVAGVAWGGTLREAVDQVHRQSRRPVVLYQQPNQPARRAQ